MSKPECRESRSVPFDPHGIVWAAAAVEGGVKGSQGGVGQESVELDKQGRLLPSPERKPLPFQAQQPPGYMSASVNTGGAVWSGVTSVRAGVAGGPAGRPPLAPTPGNLDVVREVFRVEVTALERRVAGLEVQAKMQRSLIRGFCRSELARKNGQCD